MVVDVAAEVIANTPLSAAYNVVALAAPDIAAAARPGQFVMIKPGRGLDPLLRRPFSIFEILRDGAGTPTGLTILSKRIGPSTRLLYDVRRGEALACLGPLGRPWPSIDPPQRALMVAGGVGLAPFVTLSESLRERRVSCTLFYGARSGDELFHLELFRALGVELVLTTEDGSVGERGRVTAPLDRRLGTTAGERPVVFACGPEPMMEAAAGVTARHHVECYVSMERTMGCGMGGCYSCVVPIKQGAGSHHVRSCIDGPVMRASDIEWISPPASAR